MTRRPLSSRNSSLAQKAAKWLAGRGISPNTISKSSLVFATAAGLAFCMAPTYTPALLLAALFIQARLLANLFDGMVAVEHNQKQADGGFWNEFPDRPADVLILTGMGIAAGNPTLGLLAALGALMTAYVRGLGDTLTPDTAYFQGPMAKQHRMFVATSCAVLATFLSTPSPLEIGLWIIICGSIITTWRRAAVMIKALHQDA